MVQQLDSDFLRYLYESGSQPGDRLPSLQELSVTTGISIGKLREQMEVARMLGLVEASPRRGIVRTAYSFSPPVRLSLLTALAEDRHHFEQFGSLRAHLELAYWHEAVVLLSDEDKAYLRLLIERAQGKLNQARIQIPSQEHRELHLAIFRRLNNPFVLGLLEAYWDAYEAAELNTYADYAYLCSVWTYHERIVSAIEGGEYEQGRQLLREHMQLLNSRGIAIEAPPNLLMTNGVHSEPVVA